MRGQPMPLFEKFARSEAFHNSHRSLAATTRVAGCNRTTHGEGHRQRKIQQLPA